MQGKKLLHSIRLTNLLSYGSEGVSLDLEPLNVLIGPNGSGKSNLIEAISLLAAAPRDLLKPLRQGGGTAEWIWKGKERTEAALIEVMVEYRERILSYGLSFAATQSGVSIVDEFVRYETCHGARPMLEDGLSLGRDQLEEIGSEQSMLSQHKGTDLFPELIYLGNCFSKVAFFRDSKMSRRAVSRFSQGTDLSDDFLLEDASNLGHMLNDLLSRRVTKRLILERLQEFHEDVEDITTRAEGGKIQVFLQEKGLSDATPASRLSDGTLNYLCLLVILLHPEPPPLICVEQPESIVHPDLVPKIADLFVDASQRSQFIVTTYSESLVSRLSEVSESVVVCDRDAWGTHLRRLQPEKLQPWLDRYALGDLWARGEIGGDEDLDLR